MLIQSSRRKVLQSAAAFGALAALPEWFVRRELAMAAEESKAPPLTSQPKLPVALIGCGGRGTHVAAVEGAKYVNVVAICDVDDRQISQAQQKLKGAEVYKDFRKVIERKDIKAIINGTPDHWHTLINMHALRQGKDVYGEKPLTLTIEEGQKLVQVVKESKGILQTGSQQRSDPKFRLACELVRNGRIGKLAHITTILPTGAQGGPFEEQPVPKQLDWDFWQGQAERHPFVRQRIQGLFRWWWDYSEGTITDWGAHHHDIALWAMGLDRSGPVSIDGRGIGDPVKGGFTTYPSFAIEYLYPNGVTHTSYAVPGQGPPYATEQLMSEAEREKLKEASKLKPKIADKGWRNGVRFEGSDGWIEVSRGRIDASKKELLDEPLPASATRLYKSDNHMENFVNCVKTREQPICPAEIGHRSASVCHLGAISCRLDRKLFWDPEKEEFKDDEQANTMRSRPMHDPWGYDKV
jgi:predicted dehydrogenase